MIAIEEQKPITECSPEFP